MRFGGAQERAAVVRTGASVTSSVRRVPVTGCGWAAAVRRPTVPETRTATAEVRPSHPLSNS